MQAENLPISTFISRLTEAIQKKGWRPVELSRRAGLASGTISRYLSGDRRPGADDLYRMAQSLTVSMEWLLGYGEKYQMEEISTQPLVKQSEAERPVIQSEPDIPLPQSLLDRLDARADDLGLDRLSVLKMTVKKGLDKFDKLDQDSATELAKALHRKVAEEEEGLYGEDNTEKNTG